MAGNGAEHSECWLQSWYPASMWWSVSFSSGTAPQSRVLYSCLATVQGMEWSGRAWKQGDVGGHWSERYWWPEPGCVSKDGETGTGVRGADGRKGRSY